ncbi:UNVERIFIED_CONTAM: Polyprotein P3 [Sesamum latifolium]|uniref:Polyprotein P3 n=1 Tax=Sesamum latifolium TaxID=2727402 RepID=A0AAW2TMK9_9LAMI
MIQGFNQGGQRVVGIIRMQLTMEDMVSTPLFHVIDAKTSYNILFDRPWLHENIVVPSTWHQCFKYCHNGIVEKVLGDSKPYTKAESHFADTKYYIEGDKKEKEVLPSEEPKSCGNQNTRKNDSSTIKIELSKDLILPLTQINLKQASKPPLKGFVSSTQEEEGRHETLAIDEKGFDPKAFKLLVKAGYNPKEKLSLGKLPPKATGKKLHGLNATQIMLKKKGHAIQDSRVGLDFTLPKLVRIAIKTEHQQKGMFKVTARSKIKIKSSHTQRLRSFIPSRMRSQTTLAISCEKVLKVKAQIMIFTQVESDDEDDREDDEVEEEDAEDAPVEFEEGIKATIDELKEVNLGNGEDPRPIFTSASLTQEEDEAYIAFLYEFKDMFAWSYKEMPGLDPKDLNNACPKDDFRLPIAELMIDATTGIYCYKVMPFGLKNAGATYQRAMQRIFDDMLHKNIECYVDDLVVKSKKREDHLYNLRKVFERLRRYQLKMNPFKCAFGVIPEKFLGFIVRQRGIKIEQAKIDAILRMPEPQNIHELKSLQGKLAYLRRFISNLTGRCQSFSRLMKKDIPFEWDESCDKAFKSIKSYFMKPSILVAPVHGRSLILYVAAQERSVGILLAQKNEEGKENALYYLSRTITPNELKYLPIEKLCLALIFAIQKLKHCFQFYSVHLVSKANPLKYVMTKPVLSDRHARWYLQLPQFEIPYIPEKVIKGQVLADFLADHPMLAEWELSDDLPDEDVLVIEITPPWKMYFDGASHKEEAGAGVVFVTFEGEVLPNSFTLTQNYSNNVAEYQALIFGLEMIVDTKQRDLKVYGDSQLVINQLLGLYEVKKADGMAKRCRTRASIEGTQQTS